MTDVSGGNLCKIFKSKLGINIAKPALAQTSGDNLESSDIDKNCVMEAANSLYVTIISWFEYWEECLYSKRIYSGVKLRMMNNW